MSQSDNLSFTNFLSREKFELLIKNFRKIGEPYKGNDDKRYFITQGNQFVDKFGRDEFIFPEEFFLDLYDDYLYKLIRNAENNYHNTIKETVSNYYCLPKILFYKIDFLISELEDYKIDIAKANYLDCYGEFKEKLSLSIENLIVLLRSSKIPNFAKDFEKDKIKLNLTKKEVCLLIQHFDKKGLLGGDKSTERLAELIEKHFMYRTNRGEKTYLLITNAKNTISKNINDLSHQTKSEKLTKLFKDY